MPLERQAFPPALTVSVDPEGFVLRLQFGARGPCVQLASRVGAFISPEADLSDRWGMEDADSASMNGAQLPRVLRGAAYRAHLPLPPCILSWPASSWHHSPMSLLLFLPQRLRPRPGVP